MKNIFAILALGLTLAACQPQEEAEEAKNTNDTTTKSAEASDTSGIADEDKMAYAIGSDMATSILKISQDYKAMAMNVDAVAKGFNDSLKEQGAMSKEELTQQMQIFQQKFRLAQQQKMQADSATRAAENTAFFATLDGQGYTKTESGIYYKELQAAKEGAVKPTETDKVKVHYTGTFTNGEQFDSSVEREPFQFSLKGGVIQGWIEGVKLMSVGSKYQFVIPPALGYGDRGNPRIPANSILVFDIELLEIVTEADKGEE